MRLVLVGFLCILAGCDEPAPPATSARPAPAPVASVLPRDASPAEQQAELARQMAAWEAAGRQYEAEQRRREAVERLSEQPELLPARPPAAVVVPGWDASRQDLGESPPANWPPPHADSYPAAVPGYGQVPEPPPPGPIYIPPTPPARPTYSRPSGERYVYPRDRLRAGRPGYVIQPPNYAAGSGLAGLDGGYGATNPDDEGVRGYYRSDGTWVGPYRRTRANETAADNFSARGNKNPYTGQRGDR